MIEQVKGTQNIVDENLMIACLKRWRIGCSKKESMS